MMARGWFLALALAASLALMLGFIAAVQMMARRPVPTSHQSGGWSAAICWPHGLCAKVEPEVRDL